MPNHVGNSIIVSGPEYEIERLVSLCFHMQEPEDGEEEDDDGGLEFDFGTVIPIDPATVYPLGDLDYSAANRKHWGTKWNAYDTEIVFRRPGYLNFEFNTANDFPEPIYRELGRHFPELEFDIATIDPGAWWAVAGRVTGDDAVFDENADCKTTYERVYKEPFEAALVES
jgi:hypothetical protein